MNARCYAWWLIAADGPEWLDLAARPGYIVPRHGADETRMDPRGLQDEGRDDAGALSDDALTDRVRVLQRRRGHRYSFDDVVTAYVALQVAAEAERAGAPVRAYLDLGCGLGSVLLMVADRLPTLRALGLEAQDVSFALAERNIARNDLTGRVRVEQGDLRDQACLLRLREAARAWSAASPSAGLPGCSPLPSGAAPSFGFELITGTPPYKPVGTATPSPDSQRAHARIELRGGVEDYLAAAAQLLAAAGRVVVCMEADAEARVHAGARRAGLQVSAVLPVIPIAGRKGRLFSVFTLQACAAPLGAGSAAGAAPSLRVEAPLVLRNAGGARTEAARELRLAFGLASAPDEPASPLARERGQPHKLAALSGAAGSS